MNLIINLLDIFRTQSHIPVMLFSIGLYVCGLIIIYLEARKA